MADSVMTQRLNDLYKAFNRRDGSFVINQMSPDVIWPRAFEGDFIQGQEAVRKYWEAQWQEIDPTVTPVSITQIDDNHFDVEIHQVVLDLEGKLLADNIVHHLYEFDGDLIASMTVDVPKIDLGLNH